jgi:phage terminase large subunit
LSILKVKIPAKLAPLLQPKRYKGAYGGRGGAKSHFFAEQIIFAALNGKRIVCLREVQNSIKESVKQLLSDKIRKFGLESQFDEIEHEIRGPNGSQIIFRGLQSFNASNIKSLEGFDIAWVEEAQTLSQHSLDLLRPTIRKPGSELWFSWNPRYKTDAVDKFFRSGQRDDAIAVMINWNDNPWFKDTPLYKDMLADFAADPDKAEHVWNGAYGSSQGAILARWVNDAERDGRIHNDVIYDRKGAPIIVSCDLGFRDTASWWYWQPVAGGNNVLKYDFDHGMDADDWIPRVRENLLAMGALAGNVKIWMPHDARAKTFQSKHTSQEKFGKAFGMGNVLIVPQSRKADQIEAARDVIKTCAFNAKECDAGLDGLRAWEFVYNENAGVFSREPNHNWASHPSDAFAYGAQVVKLPIKDAPPKPPKFWNDQTLQELWESTPKNRSNRI